MIIMIIIIIIITFTITTKIIIIVQQQKQQQNNNNNNNDKIIIKENGLTYLALNVPMSVALSPFTRRIEPSLEDEINQTTHISDCLLIKI